MRSNPTGRVIGAGLAAATVAGGAAIALAVSPAANATVDTISSSSTTPVVGGTYTLSADLSGASVGLLVAWADNGANLTDPAQIVPWPAGHTSVTWKPTTAGQHVITLNQGDSTKSLVLTVTDNGAGGTTTTAPTTTAPPAATTTPPTSTPATTAPGSGSGTGSFGSGSATGSAGALISGLLRGLFGSS
ncbi:hypothetical protein D7D52_06285 [Nocardia yunnanensis]|uniref:Uncharacterized protein n=1 Tax=Nocardia yunnanensis TaxID=2382165 RepID=A0A386Z7A8_9NOCA|nr:hypothetical protein [Nocardia yunnanensis]AYF73531.1 hypothetical protein D7D52_06285 [Nocardia yunnanensis]